ncbi:MAG TPA: alpha/beta hydrolase [Microthrixaceae bacterium]|nr:alpha/beta hydrolase [Microthrixaceae bacterium]
MTTEQPGYRFDPELAPFVPLLPVEGDWSDMAAARAAMSALVAGATADLPPLEGVEWTDHEVPGPGVAPAVPVRVYRPAGAEASAPAVLYLHGGGFCMGDLESEHRSAAVVALAADAVVVSVGYRLAPEDPYPAGLEDCYAALCWLAASANELDVDVERLAVMGASAGGGLAAATAIVARDRGGPELVLQVLGIPELDDRLITPSMTTFVDTPMWNRPMAELSWQAYLGASAGGDEVPISAAPARATPEQLVGLPPAFVTTMEFDPLRDEGIHYALALLAAGVSVELHQYPGTFHGSAMMHLADVSRREAEATRHALVRGLRPELFAHVR